MAKNGDHPRQNCKAEDIGAAPSPLHHPPSHLVNSVPLSPSIRVAVGTFVAIKAKVTDGKDP